LHKATKLAYAMYTEKGLSTNQTNHKVLSMAAERVETTYSYILYYGISKLINLK